jgi:hypothetical protein
MFKKGDLIIIRSKARTWMRIPDGADVGPYITEPTLALVTAPHAYIMCSVLKAIEAADWYIEVTTVDNQNIIITREQAINANSWTQ